MGKISTNIGLSMLNYAIKTQHNNNYTFSMSFSIINAMMKVTKICNLVMHSIFIDTAGSNRLGLRVFSFGRVGECV